MPRVVGWRDGWEGGWKQARGWSESFFQKLFRVRDWRFFASSKVAADDWERKYWGDGKGECVRVSRWRCEREGGVGPGEGWIGGHVRCAGVRGATHLQVPWKPTFRLGLDNLSVSQYISHIYHQPSVAAMKHNCNNHLLLGEIIFSTIREGNRSHHQVDG